MLVAAASCATVAIGTWLVHAVLGASLGAAAMTLIAAAALVCLLLACGAGIVALARSGKG